MYLLDTDTLVHLLRGHGKVTDNVKAHADAFQAFSAASYGELMYGARKSKRPEENAARVRRLAEDFPVVEVSVGIMENFGALKAELESRGERLDDFDLVIAATARQLGFTLVTSNTRHFARVPDLRTEDWAV
jgi:tRNA(fMet)-specific endonuclease VapC